ncbi:lysylphosphatidylglycerol synthase domain-containing protein [Agromyces sp. MMS24-K17]|uniref:lysylphosphatidylglycerol synthase domain-containing protein n=1 Tax=Agromyces sp. MMS24-K17 TaxID=3372850 RepID=UPI0037544D9A
MTDRAPERRRRWPRVLRSVVAIVVIGAVGCFFVITLIRNWDQVAAQHLEFSWWWLVAGVLFAAAVPLTGYLWGRILRTLSPDAEVSLAEAVAVQCASWLLKYIPGQVGSVVNKVIWAGKKQISRVLVVITFVYENVFLQIVSIVPSLVVLAFALGPETLGANAPTILLPTLIILPLAAFVYRPVFHRVMSVLLRRALKQEVPPEEYFLRTPKVVGFLFEFLGPRVLNGVGFVLIAATVTDVEPSDWLPLASAYVLAGAIGILAVFVPSGLGVREGVVVLLLGFFMPVTAAIVVSLLARLISTASDGIVALLYAGVRRSIPKEFRP